MGELSVDDFEEYFAGIWRCDAFPWQSELVRQVHHERCWPDLVDLPTGSGKTTVIDMAVFLLAVDAGRPAHLWWMPRRVVLVVDRRVVVAQAADRGRQLAKALASPSGGVLRSVADALRCLSGNGPPLVSTLLQGGIVRDESWAHRPDLPAVISSTVDQVGSRLLFRGYGLSPGMRPIHAGLLGNDALFLLDEVHIARPFAETLAAVGSYRSWHDEGAPGLPDRWQVVQLTATPTGRRSLRRFPEAPLDPGSHPVLSRRLTAAKPVRLEMMKVAKDIVVANQQFATRCVQLAHDLLRIEHIRTVGVIVNRVDTARRVAAQLAEGAEEVDVVLLTGRMRGLDRDRVLLERRDRLRIGRERRPDDRPLVVVATQSIEAGADFDLDGVVTECASFDALRQRFGRVDRDGQLASAGTPSHSIIAVRSSDIDIATPDPIYGRALAATWAWLSGLGQVDFGVSALAATINEEGAAALLPPHDRAPRLLPGHLDQWAQTSQPPPDTEASVGRWLHGIGHEDAVDDIALVWRADFDATVLSSATWCDNDDGWGDQISARIAACPPLAGETLSVPLGEFRRWALGCSGDPLGSDVTGAQVDQMNGRSTRAQRAIVRWRQGRAELIAVGAVGPGDTLLVPAGEGGISMSNWDPASGAPVSDLALEAAARRGRAVARLSTGLHGTNSGHPDPDVLEDESKPTRVTAIRGYLAALAAQAEEGNDALAATVFRHLAAQTGALRVRCLVDHVDLTTARRSYIVTTTTPLPPTEGVSAFAGNDIDPDDGFDSVSFTGAHRVNLDSHLRGVASWAEQLGSHLGLDETLVADLVLAGRLHDLGKADTRFQRWIGGTRSGDLLAKSSTPDLGRVARQKARAVSGYPKGVRHELLSVAMIHHPDGPIAAAHDPDLVRYLIASHHGFGRYRFDPCLDPTPETVHCDTESSHLSASSDHGLHRLDAGMSDMFWTLVHRYGWFGLTWLEAIVRLADHARSRDERQQESNDRPLPRTPA